MSSNTAIVSDVLSEKKLRQKLHIGSNKKWFMLAAALGIIFLVVALVLDNKSKPVKSSDTKHLSALLVSYNCSSPSMNSVSSLQPSTNAPNASIELFNYRIACAIKDNDNSKAISVLEQAQKFALQVHDTTAASNYNTELINLNNVPEQSNSGTKK